MKQITKKVFVENDLLACNLGLIVTSEGIVMIDTPIKPSDALKWKEKVLEYGPIRYLITSEDHGDHACNSYFFPAEHIVSSISAREAIANTPRDFVLGVLEKVEPDSAPLLKDYKLLTADITFAGAMELHLGGLTIRLIPLPGHTERVIGVYIPEERVVFASDLIFNRLGTFLSESDPDAWLKSLQSLKELDVDYIVPGHGEVCTKDYLDEQAAVVKNWVQVVKSAIEKGLSEEEALATLKSPDPYSVQAGTGFTDEYLRTTAIKRFYKLYSK